MDNVEEFATIAPPANLTPAFRGNHLSTAGSRKGLDVNFEPAERVRLLRDPLSVGVCRRREEGTSGCGDPGDRWPVPGQLHRHPSSFGTIDRHALVRFLPLSSDEGSLSHVQL